MRLVVWRAPLHWPISGPETGPMTDCCSSCPVPELVIEGISPAARVHAAR